MDDDHNQNGAAAIPNTFKVKSPNALFLYFHHLADNFTDLGSFRNNWQLIGSTELEPKHLALILASIATVKYESGKDQFQIRHSQFESRPNREISGKIIQYVDRQFDSWEESAEKVIDQFDAHAITTTLWSLGKLNIIPTVGFLKNLDEQAVKILKKNPKNFTPQGLTNTIAGFANLGIRPSQEFLKAWENSYLEQISEIEKNPNHLILSARSLASLGIRPSAKFVDAWKKGIEKTQGNFREQHISNTLWTCTIFDILNVEPEVKSTANKIFAHHKIEKLENPINNQQINQAAKWFDFSTELKIHEETRTKSTFEIKLKKDFARAGQKIIRTPVIVAETGHIIDIGIINEPSILLEVEGSSHIVLSYETGKYLAAGYNGGTFLRDALTSKFKKDSIIISLPHTMMEELDYEGNREELNEIIELAKNLSCGTYYLSMTNGNWVLLPMPILSHATDPIRLEPSYTA